MGLFREHTEGPDTGFEVYVTCNAIISNPQGTNYFMLFGLDSEWRYSAPQCIVRIISDARRIPTTFDFEELLQTQRISLPSGFRVARFLNIVYVFKRFVPSRPAATRRRRDH